MGTDGERFKDRTIRQAMDDFLASLNALYTQQTYSTPLKHFAAFLATVGVHVDRDPVTVLTVDQAIDFVPWLRHEHFPDPDQPAKATLQLYLTAVYRLYRSLLKRGVTLEAADIARLEESYRDARNIRGEPRPKDPKLEAVEAVIRAARSVPSVRGDKAADRMGELSRLRDIAIVETLRSTGCRVGELVGMRRGDLDWMAHSALVKGKGSKYRKVYWDETAWRALKVYLQAREDGGDARGLARLPVFCGHGNRSGSTPSPLTTRHVSRTIQALAEQGGIAEAGVTPHYFRHVFATRALDRTDNLALVQDMLGHASPATTRVYARTDERQRREGYARVWGEGEEVYHGGAEGAEEEGREREVYHRDTEGTEEGRFEATVPVLDVVRDDLPSPIGFDGRGAGGEGQLPSPIGFDGRGAGGEGQLPSPIGFDGRGAGGEGQLPSPVVLDGRTHSDGRGAGGEGQLPSPIGFDGRGAGGEGLLLSLLRATGCSLQELVSLRLGDLERATHMVRLVSYSEIRQVQLDRQTWGALEAYLRANPTGEGEEAASLFRDVDGAPLTVERAYEILLAYVARMGMDRDELHHLL